MEMAIDSVENRPQVADITQNVPEFLPPHLVWGESLPNNSMAVVGDNSENVYVFKFFNNGNDRQLAGWTKWTYPSNVVMFGSEDDLSHLVLYDGTNHVLVRSELIDDPEDAPLNAGFSSFTPRLDMYIPSEDITVTVKDELNSLITIPEDQRIDGVIYNLISIAGDQAGFFLRPEPIKESDGWYLEVNTEILSDSYLLGIQYETVVELPSVFVTKDNKADRRNIPQVTMMYLELYYSGRYDITVNKLGYDPVQMTAEIPLANIYVSGTVPINEISVQRVPIYCSGDNVNVTVKCPDPFPSSITGYSWEGSYNNRGIRAI
jgi:hypothetical protein